MKVKNAQKRTPGSVTFRSRCTSEGASSRNAANAFAKPAVAAASVGIDVCGARNWNCPRGPPLSCVCSRKSRVCRKSSPTLIVWLPFTFVKTVANWIVRSERSHGRLPEKPTNGLLRLRPVPKSIDVMPLDQSSMFAPRMPTSCAVVSPAPPASASLWK